MVYGPKFMVHEVLKAAVAEVAGAPGSPGPTAGAGRVGRLGGDPGSFDRCMVGASFKAVQEPPKYPT